MRAQMSPGTEYDYTTPCVPKETCVDYPSHHPATSTPLGRALTEPARLPETTRGYRGMSMIPATCYSFILPTCGFRFGPRRPPVGAGAKRPDSSPHVACDQCQMLRGRSVPSLLPYGVFCLRVHYVSTPAPITQGKNLSGCKQTWITDHVISPLELFNH